MASRLTLTSLSRALLEKGTVTDDALVSLLGTARHGDDDAPLQEALVATGLLGEQALVDLLATLTGRDPGDLAAPGVPDLPQDVAERTRTIVLGTDPPTIATTTTSLELLEEAYRSLGRAPRSVIIPAPHFTRLFRDTYTHPASAAAATPKDLYALLDATVALKGSDVHLTVGRPPVIRVRGTVEFLDYAPLETGWLLSQLTQLAKPENMAEYELRKTTDFAYSFGDRRFRVNVANDRRGPTMVARLLPKDIPSMDDLGLSDAIRKFADLERGLVLVTGPTGSGKSTTLAALLAEIARRRACHITTLEDPIEFVHRSDGLALVTQRELGKDFESFAGALRAALRQDPDVILIGEMRDRETIRAALEAAETGHLVFGTLHTMSAPQTINRIVSTFPANEQDHVRGVLGAVLKGVVSQTLLPTADGLGRVGAFEVLVGTPAVAYTIQRPDGDLTQLIELGSKDGMCLMDKALAGLVRSGQVTRAEADFRAKNLKALDDYIKLPPDAGSARR